MCGSDPEKVKGGIVSVVNSILGYEDWEEVQFRYVSTHREGGKVTKTLCFCLGYLRAAWYLLFGQADLVHLHVSERGSFYRKALILRLAKSRKKPVLLHHHGADFDLFFEGLSEEKQSYVRKILEMADCNLLLSRGVQDALLRKAPGAKTEILHNAVCVPKENPYREENDAIVTLGRLGERKGTYDLLKAIRLIDKQLPEQIKVYLCGDGEVEEVNRLVKEYGLTERVARTGWIAGEDKEKLLGHTLCHVLPSYREVLPMSILETMAKGIPNIATRIASVPEVIEPEKNGFLIEPGDVRSLADALLRFCGDRELSREMSRHAYEKINAEFSQKVCFARLKKIYRAQLAGQQG